MIARAENVKRAVDRKRVKNYCDTEKHDASNRIAALVIMETPEKYEGALLMWAKMFLERVK